MNVTSPDMSRHRHELGQASSPSSPSSSWLTAGLTSRSVTTTSLLSSGSPRRLAICMGSPPKVSAQAYSSASSPASSSASSALLAQASSALSAQASSLLSPPLMLAPLLTLSPPTTPPSDSPRADPYANLSRSSPSLQTRSSFERRRPSVAVLLDETIQKKDQENLELRHSLNERDKQLRQCQEELQKVKEDVRQYISANLQLKQDNDALRLKLIRQKKSSEVIDPNDRDANLMAIISDANEENERLRRLISDYLDKNKEQSAVIGDMKSLLQSPLMSSTLKIHHAQGKRLEPVINQSKIITLRHAEIIESWLPEGKKIASMLYQASTHGFRPAQFHQQCDNKGATVVVVKTSAENGGHIFGGYADSPWDSSNKEVHNQQNFIFTMTNPHDIPPTKFVHNPNKSVSQLNIASYGPIFGNSDFEIHPKSNVESRSMFGANNVTFINDTGKHNALFTNPRHASRRGEHQQDFAHFTTADIEVYSVQ